MSLEQLVLEFKDVKETINVNLVTIMNDLRYLKEQLILLDNEYV
jgi:hypothetical protein